MIELQNFQIEKLHSEKQLNSKHFLIVKELKNEENEFWNEINFEKFMKSQLKLKLKKMKQGGGISKMYIKKTNFSFDNEEKNYLIFGILFEKRMNLSNKNIFQFSYYDFLVEKEFFFSDSIFYKIHKKNFHTFLKI